MRSGLLILVMAMATAVGCTRPATPTAALPPATGPSPAGLSAPTSYPAPAIGGPTPPGYPGPQPTTPLPTAIPVDTAGTPIAGRGNVTGAIINQVPNGQAVALAAYELYLARLRVTDKGMLTTIAGVDEQTAPKTVTDDRGAFVFVNVEPGWYALVIKHPLHLVLATETSTGEDTVVEVKADQVSDLGLIHVALGG